MASILKIVLISIFGLSNFAQAANQDKAYCEIDIRYPRYFTRYDCKNVGIDGRSVDELIRQSPIIDHYNQEVAYNITFTELASTIQTIDLQTIKGNITIKENSLRDIPNLEYLMINSHLYGRPRNNFYLNISPNEFSNTPNLTLFTAKGLTFTNDTMQALGTMTDRITSLTIVHCSPSKELLKLAGRFTKLLKLELAGLGDDQTSPASAFKKSASMLREIKIEDWYVPQLKKEWFRGMVNVLNLIWRRSNLTKIEAGAFDEMPRLLQLYLQENKFTHLPDGLFNRNKNLKEVNLSGGSQVENLSRNNFTHIDDFGGFRLRMGRDD